MGSEKERRKGRVAERARHEVSALKKINHSKDPSLASVVDGISLTNEHKKKGTKKREAGGNDIEVNAIQDEALFLENSGDLNNNDTTKTEKEKKKKKKRKSEQGNDEKESEKAGKKNKTNDDVREFGEVEMVLKETHMGVGENMTLQKEDSMELPSNFELEAGKDRKMSYKERESKSAAYTVSSVVNVLEDNGCEREGIIKMINRGEGYAKKEKKKKKKRLGGGSDVEVTKSVTDAKEVGNGRDNLQVNTGEKGESSRNERKIKKKNYNTTLEAASPEIMVETHVNESIPIEGNGGSTISSKNEAGERKREVNAHNAEGGKEDKREKKKWNGCQKEGIDKMINRDEGYVKKKEKKKKKKRYGNGSDIEVTKSVTDAKKVGGGRENLEGNIMERGESPRDERKKNKKNRNNNLEAASPEIMVETLVNESIQKEGNGGSTISSKKEAEDGKPEVNAHNAEGGNKDKRQKKKRKRYSDNVVTNKLSDAKEVGNESQHLDKNIQEKSKERKKKQKHNSDFEAMSHEIRDEKQGTEGSVVVANEGNTSSYKSKARGAKMKSHDVNSEGENKVRKKKAKSVENGSKEEGSKSVPRINGDVEATSPSEKSTPKGTSKRVSFSEDVEVFPLSDSLDDEEAVQEEALVQGRRFSLEEDAMVKEAVFNYIYFHGLGNEGIKMVMNCRKHPEVKNCWKEIAVALPWRPQQSVYYRAHILFERDESHSWTQEEYELVRKFHEKYGSDWRTLADAMGKHRLHTKDAWRRIKLPNKKKGNWSQEEYQTLFDLVNVDLRMKAFEEKKSKHGMLRDNIAWTAISSKLETRSDALCCSKWYDQLASPMVAEGKWLDTDDYRLLIELYELDACCMEDVNWDNLLEHRSGDLCRKRWSQMVKHLGEHRNKSFSEQVEVLINRYCPDVLEAREAYNSKPALS